MTAPFWTFLCGSVLLAMLLDWFWGEPHAQVHPVVWMGRYLGWVSARFAPLHEEGSSGAKVKSFTFGALFWLLGGLIVLITAWLLQVWTLRVSWWLALGVTGFFLNSVFSLKLLINEVLQVDIALNQSLDQGRTQLKRLVSRDVSNLSDVQIRESAIESLAENLNDSFVAPLFWFLLGGLPAAALYRFANTADAMWGYKGFYGRYHLTWFGKWTARADDLLSWAPALISTVLICLVSRSFKFKKIMTEATKTPSPNGGWPMGAMAIALGVKLSKPNVYVLNPQGQYASAYSVGQACQIARHIFIFIFVVTLMTAILSLVR